MCKCHAFNSNTGKIERIKGIFPLKTGNVGDKFKFPHENFYRVIVEMNFKTGDVFAPPLTDDYNGMDEKGTHTFHFSFKAEFDGFEYETNKA
jgi:hypothetical protein